MHKAQNALVKRMLTPSFYDHPVTEVELVETHISWIFLAGDFAYKLKKPVNFGFLDFSTLEKRQYFCQEELRLNKRFAPQLYLEIVRIGGEPASPKLNGEPAIDYVVKMRRFPQRRQLDRMLAAGELSIDHIERFAEKIAQIHRHAPVTETNSKFGSPQLIIEPILQNFVQIRRFLPDTGMVQQVDMLESWSRAAHAKLRKTFLQRQSEGFIRECHGDVHLANMAWFDGAPLLFDRIEFNENLRWIDPINDVAFLAMDLEDRGEAALNWRFLNRYLRETGDYPGMVLLNFYKVYRALVRAKVACLRLSQADLDEKEKSTDLHLAHSYLELATGYIAPHTPRLIICHGLSGSGKTTFVNELAPLCGAISLHSDIERKRLHGLAATAASHSPVDGGIYSATATEDTYKRLLGLAEMLLGAGFNTIVDATFIKRQPREAMSRLAEKLKIPLYILDFPLSAEELQQRIIERTRQPGQISEANHAVLEFQQTHEEPLSSDELKNVVRVLPGTRAETIAAQFSDQK